MIHMHTAYRSTQYALCTDDSPSTTYCSSFLTSRRASTDTRLQYPCGIVAQSTRSTEYSMSYHQVLYTVQYQVLL